ncbi:UNVERIFIED_CONTAM: hypothetical protein K2H54_051388 [Gekko kuhli]
MSKRFESGASKRKRLENAMVLKLRPITAFVHQPLIEATRARSEAIQPERTTSMQPDKNLPERKTAKQDVEQQADYKKAAMMLAQTENTELIQESLTGQGEAKEPQENNINSQILQFTPDGLSTERFLTFLELKDHSGESMDDLVLNYFTAELEIDFRKCHRQSYDNSANMAASKQEIQQGVELLMEAYPEDIDLTLIDELLHFHLT